ncbi:enolase-phosphatase E1-like [Branchiostoma lanceolatum]|uniref:enolase-phosphatase E1-like n=1 Tax=Branchiostoma lanceolatum TaxID=7740 RepID=UPI003451D711
MGVAMLMMRLLGFIPSGIYFGAMVDTTCTLWGSTCGSPGACLLYDHDQFRHRFFGLSQGIGAAQIVVTLIAAWVFKRRERSDPASKIGGLTTRDMATSMGSLAVSMSSLRMVGLTHVSASHKASDSNVGTPEVGKRSEQPVDKVNHTEVEIPAASAAEVKIPKITVDPPAYSDALKADGQSPHNATPRGLGQQHGYLSLSPTAYQQMSTNVSKQEEPAEPKGFQKDKNLQEIPTRNEEQSANETSEEAKAVEEMLQLADDQVNAMPTVDVRAQGDKEVQVAPEVLPVVDPGVGAVDTGNPENAVKSTKDVEAEIHSDHATILDEKQRDEVNPDEVGKCANGEAEVHPDHATVSDEKQRDEVNPDDVGKCADGEVEVHPDHTTVPDEKQRDEENPVNPDEVGKCPDGESVVHPDQPTSPDEKQPAEKNPVKPDEMDGCADGEAVVHPDQPTIPDEKQPNEENPVNPDEMGGFVDGEAKIHLDQPTIPDEKHSDKANPVSPNQKVESVGAGSEQTTSAIIHEENDDKMPFV